MLTNTYKSLLNRIEELEYKFGIIQNESNEEDDSFGCTNFSKKLINYNLIEKKKFILGEFDVRKNEDLFITCQVDANLQSSQNLYINLYINNTVIYSGTKAMLSGEDSALIFTSFTPTKNEHAVVTIEISPLKGILLIVKNINFIVVGLKNIEIPTDYQILELNDKYLLSINKNNMLYYSYVTKTISEYSLQDFILYKSSKSHSFSFLKNSSTLFLFRIDQNGKLIACNFDNGSEYLISDNVEWVSAASDENKIIVCYIKNNSCFMVEIRNLPDIYIEKRINFSVCSLKKCIIYFNKFRNKFCLILSDKTNSNYLIESEEEDYSHGENISAEYYINLSTYGGNL